MPLNKRQLALTVSVLTFFLVSITGVLHNVSPVVCCKRALLCMIAAYIAVSIIVKFTNYLVINAMVSKQVDKIMENSRDSNDSSN